MEKQLRYIIGSLNIGGAERHLARVLPELVKRGWQIQVLTLMEKGSLAPELEKAGVTIKNTPLIEKTANLPSVLKKAFKLYLVMFFLCSEFIKNRKALTHFFLPESYIMGMIAALSVFLKAPKIMSRRSLNYYQQKYKGIAFIEKMLHQKCDRISGNSMAIINQLEDEESAPEDRLEIIYNGLDIKPFEKAKSIRKKLGIDDETTVLTIVANLIPYKGHSDLIDALALHKKDMPEKWVLLCVGKDNGIQSVLELKTKEAELENNIKWLGERKDIPDILCSSDIGILCSHEEGFSNSILEYMASGLAVVATDVGGNKEAVTNGKTGFVVPAKAPDELGKAIAGLVSSPDKSRKMGRAGKKRIKEEFTIEKCVDKYERMYESCYKNKS